MDSKVIDDMEIDQFASILWKDHFHGHCCVKIKRRVRLERIDLEVFID